MYNGVSDYIKCIENNDKDTNEYNIIAIKHHLTIIYNNLLLFYNLEKMTKLGYFITRQKLRYQVFKTDIFTMKQELKIILWLFNNIDYLYDYDNKNKAISLINIYYYLTLIDFNRVEFLELNINKGRTIINTNPLLTMQQYLDEIIKNLTIFDDKNEELKKELVKDEK